LRGGEHIRFSCDGRQGESGGGDQEEHGLHMASLSGHPVWRHLSAFSLAHELSSTDARHTSGASGGAILTKIPASKLSNHRYPVPSALFMGEQKIAISELNHIRFL